MSYVLFSPIGGTDPISNERDGSMLHICRKYKPECVVLYLSGEMAERHHQDDRYCACLRRLAESLDFSPEIKVEERSDLVEVQIYDVFYQEFRPLLCELHDRYPEHTLILNISSGTPAMKSALYLLAAFLPFKVLPIQVSTPVKAQNPHLEPHADYDPDLYWECNLDQLPEYYQDRCEEVRYQNLNAQLQRESISAHLRAYDYSAALDIARKIRPLLSDRAYALLEAARARTELNWRGIPAALREEFGITGSNGARNDVAEYLLWLQMKQKRGDLADFLRGLTPALFNLLKIAAEEQAGWPLSRYCDKYLRLDRNKLLKDEKGREMLNILESGDRPMMVDRRPFLLSAHYVAILKAKCPDKPWVRHLARLREFEEIVRNKAAHTITRMDEKWLKKQMESPASSDEMIQLIREAVREMNADTALPLSQKIKVNWGAYHEMNQKIEAAMAVL